MKYPNERGLYNERTNQTQIIFTIASVWVSLYFFCVKPYILYSSVSVEKTNDSTSTITNYSPTITWRFPFFFKSWTEYERAHAFFWLLKDTGWVYWIPPMVVIFFIPTALLALDFVWVSMHVRTGLIDHAHYCSTLLWLTSASVWAAGEFYLTPNHDTAVSMFKWNREAKITSRWYASWFLLAAFLPIIALYLIWIPSTLLGTPIESCQYGKEVKKSIVIVNGNIANTAL
jgi:hypothetical protein